MDLPQGICAPVLQPHEFQRRGFRTASSRNPFALSGPLMRLVRFLIVTAIVVAMVVLAALLV